MTSINNVDNKENEDLLKCNMADVQTKTDDVPVGVETEIKKKKKKKIVKKIVKKKKKKSFLDEILAKNDEILDKDDDCDKIRFRPYGIDDFRLVQLLGEGGFGAVYLAKLIGHRHYFALKFVSKATIIEMEDFDAVENEKKVMQLANHCPFLCRLFATFQTPKYLCLAMQFCSGGNLKFHLDRERRFQIGKTRFYLAQMVCSLEFLHKRGFIYRDLKLENVMITGTGNIQLVDFGLCAGKIYREEMQPTEFAGTVEYMAPEVIKGQKYNQSVDYWSLGIVAYEMSVGCFPFTGTDEDEICWMVCHQPVTFPSAFDNDLRSLIVGLLCKSAPERLGMDNCPLGKLREQIFFAGLKWSDVENCRLKAPFIPDRETSIRDLAKIYFTQQTNPHHIIDLKSNTQTPEHTSNHSPSLSTNLSTNSSSSTNLSTNPCSNDNISSNNIQHEKSTTKFASFNYTNPFITN